MRDSTNSPSAAATPRKRSPPVCDFLGNAARGHAFFMVLISYYNSQHSQDAHHPKYDTKCSQANAHEPEPGCNAHDDLRMLHTCT